MSGWRHWLTAGLGRVLLGKVGAPSRRQPQPLDAIARLLSDQGWSHYREDESYTIEDGIELMEAAWALSRNPDTACRLGVMYDRANRNADATPLYRKAAKLFPAHADLRYQAAAHVLRHGGPEDVRGFFELVRKIDPLDPFEQYATMMMEALRAWPDHIVNEITRTYDARPPLLLCIPVWGDGHVADFLKYTCWALLAPGNLPSAGRRCSVHLVIFTTEGGEASIRSDPVYEALRAVVAVHFLRFPAGAIDDRGRMEKHYGPRLGSLYARNCKFLLFSTPHYAALEAGRHLGAWVMPLGADGIFCDGAIDRILCLMERGVDVVAATGFRLSRQDVIGDVETRFRRPDRVLQISPRDYGHLLAKHLPDAHFAKSTKFSAFPIFLCWRSDSGGVLVHSTHYHPCCIRSDAVRGPITLTIDPVDGRFLTRHFADLERVHLVADTSITFSEWSENPLVVDSGSAAVVPEKVSLWLWMYWDELRERYFRTPITIDAGRSGDWSVVESEAQGMVETILEECLRREARNVSRTAWR